MVIRIESLSVENLRCFNGEHQLDLGENDEASIDVISGPNSSGKTTLADSIQLCLTGEFEDEALLVTYELVDQLSPGEEVSAKVSAVISDSDLDRKFRFSREFQTSETRRGPVNSVDSLQVEEEEGGDWVSVSSSEAVNTVFPLQAFTFCKLDSDSSIGIDNPWGGTSWSELVEDVGEAAAQQSAARGVDLPDFFSNSYDLGDEMLCRVNDLLDSIDGRYRVEERQDGLVGRSAENGSGGKVQSLPAGQQILISQAAALVAGEMMIATPPLIGDSIFGRVDRNLRKDLAEVIQEMDRHVLLFVIEPELEGLDLNPRFKLERTQKDMSSQIVSLE
ncbi:AAA family ATPase [Halarchaeum acidiphilum]|uniref:AAA family ATPase n=1 Tax=Halarchaeum acidiphilum TaxID=489138 RepID=UPI000376E746